MTRTRRLISMGAALVGVLGLVSCTAVEAAPAESPISVEEIDGTDFWRLTLTASAADRLDIETATVDSAGDRRVVPSAAVIIDPEGHYWVYTSREPLVFVREQISPVVEEADQAFFDEGPEVGTAVVVTGVPELYGAEFGIGK